MHQNQRIQAYSLDLKIPFRREVGVRSVYLLESGRILCKEPQQKEKSRCREARGNINEPISA